MTARHIIRLRDGRRVEAIEVEYGPGWLAVLAIRTRIELDLEAGVGRKVFDGLRRRTFPAGGVLEVIDLDEASEATA